MVLVLVMMVHAAAVDISLSAIFLLLPIFSGELTHFVSKHIVAPPRRRRRHASRKSIGGDASCPECLYVCVLWVVAN